MMLSIENPNLTLFPALITVLTDEISIICFCLCQGSSNKCSELTDVTIKAEASGAELCQVLPEIN